MKKDKVSMDLLKQIEVWESALAKLKAKSTRDLLRSNPQGSLLAQLQPIIDFIPAIQDIYIKELLTVLAAESRLERIIYILFRIKRLLNE